MLTRRVQSFEMAFRQAVKAKNDVLRRLLVALPGNAASKGIDEFRPIIKRWEEGQAPGIAKLLRPFLRLDYGCLKTRFSVLRVKRENDNPRDILRMQSGKRRRDRRVAVTH